MARLNRFLLEVGVITSMVRMKMASGPNQMGELEGLDWMIPDSLLECSQLGSRFRSAVQNLPDSVFEFDFSFSNLLTTIICPEDEMGQFGIKTGFENLWV